MPNRSFEIAIRYLYTVFSVSRGKTPPIKEAAMIMMVHGKLITLRVGSMRGTPFDPDCRPSADRGNIRSSQGGPRALPAEQRRDVAAVPPHGVERRRWTFWLSGASFVRRWPLRRGAVYGSIRVQSFRCSVHIDRTRSCIGWRIVRRGAYYSRRRRGDDATTTQQFACASATSSASPVLARSRARSARDHRLVQS